MFLNILYFWGAKGCGKSTLIKLAVKKVSLKKKKNKID